LRQGRTTAALRLACRGRTWGEGERVVRTGEPVIYCRTIGWAEEVTLAVAP
jgi:hypothetical protein